jgi:hypothetical protein
MAIFGDDRVSTEGREYPVAIRARIRRSLDGMKVVPYIPAALAIRSNPAYLTFVLRGEAAMSRPKLTTTGTELVVEDTPEGVLLKVKPAFAPTRPKDVFGSLPHKGSAKSFADMEAGIAAEAKRRHARNRY